jgi:hypothetical protein
MDIDLLRRFIAELNTPFVPLGSTLDALRHAALNARIVHRPLEGDQSRLALELEAWDRRTFVDIASVGVAYLHHFGWWGDEPAEDWEPVIGSEDLIDAILAALGAPSIGVRAWCSSEWTVRARVSAGIDHLLSLSTTG